MSQQGSGQSQVNPLVKLAIDIGPLAVFFYLNSREGIFAGTAGFMVAIVIAVAVSWYLEKRVPVMPLVTGIFVLVFGGLTLILQDELFIKLKPTIVNTLFAVILIIGLMLRRLFLRHIFGHAFQINREGWEKLTRRWIGFFLFLALLNEVVWRNFSTDDWVNFKVFGIMPITLVFSLSLLPLIKRHSLPDDPS